MTVAMADGIDSGQEARRRSMLPGSARDSLVSAAKWGFPIGSVLLFAVLLVLPVTRNREFSFLLSKDSAAHSGERMRIQEAEYRGETSRGEDPERQNMGELQARRISERHRHGDKEG